VFLLNKPSGLLLTRDPNVSHCTLTGDGRHEAPDDRPGERGGGRRAHAGPEPGHVGDARAVRGTGKQEPKGAGHLVPGEGTTPPPLGGEIHCFVAKAVLYAVSCLAYCIICYIMCSYPSYYAGNLAIMKPVLLPCNYECPNPVLF